MLQQVSAIKVTTTAFPPSTTATVHPHHHLPPPHSLFPSPFPLPPPFSTCSPSRTPPPPPHQSPPPPPHTPPHHHHHTPSCQGAITETAAADAGPRVAASVIAIKEQEERAKTLQKVGGARCAASHTPYAYACGWWVLCYWWDGPRPRRLSSLPPHPPALPAPLSHPSKTLPHPSTLTWAPQCPPQLPLLPP